MNWDFYNKLIKISSPERIRTNELLSRHTTFRIGGAADYFIAAKDGEEAAWIIRLCLETGMPHFLIGNGSNLLAADEGYRGAIIKLPDQMKTVQFWEEDGMLHAKAGAGEPLTAFARMAAKLGAAGFAFAAGIPGSIGGAVCMNAGAYGGEIKDCLASVLLLDKTGAIRRAQARELALCYRSSSIQGTGEYVLEAEFAFPKEDAKKALEKIEEYARQRKEKQPLEYPSAGSTFKRPEGNFAGKLIMEAGLAGLRIGGAQVSTKHCGFVINVGGASAKDVLCLMRQVQTIVKDKFGIHLEPEIKLLQ